MPFAELGRVALVVDDIDAVAKSLKDVLDIELKIVNAEGLGIKAGVGNNGIELVEQVAESRVAKYWRKPLAALIIHVENAEEANKRMEAAGFNYIQTATAAGGLKEYLYGPEFLGAPVVLHETSGDLLHDIGEGGETKFEWRD